MDPANEETGSVPRPQPLPQPSPPQSSTPSNAGVTDSTAPSKGATDSSSNNGNNSSRDNNNVSILPQPQPRTHTTSKDRPVSGVVPPYWSHHRDTSRTSQASLEQLPPISLEDHTEDPDSETTRGLWAQSVSIDDYAVVQGKTGVGSYVVWNCTINTLEQGGPITVRLRYSEFDDLRRRLAASFPHAKNALPVLPPKSIIYKFRPAFLESRRIGLAYFLNCVLLNPEFSSSPVVKEFLFGRTC
ncbi:Phox-like protein [Aspergillus campestris IBT 28561]|uniref:Endosomal/vacuolar adapter protein YPT35 n=1 Tax=Aspergillus campestris (strain IBT 28561) TaxID=1392248 RepID=A0A2I1DAS9_ASPC2|nr:Phox-like protein [Aspergillus campestris IBT 28561]PKY06970.1 Phox-like protein [Aspergillus campestris IBT 28561]